MVKPPFSIRLNPERQEEFVALRKGIPSGLRPSLLRWTMFRYAGSDDVGYLGVYEYLLGLLERLTDKIVLPDGHRDSRRLLRDALSSDDELHLDAVDVALRFAGRRESAELESYLRDARSAYCVKQHDDDKYELQNRQSEEMSRLIDNEANQPGAGCFTPPNRMVKVLRAEASDKRGLCGSCQSYRDRGKICRHARRWEGDLGKDVQRHPRQARQVGDGLGLR